MVLRLGQPLVRRALEAAEGRLRVALGAFGAEALLEALDGAPGSGLQACNLPWHICTCNDPYVIPM